MGGRGDTRGVVKSEGLKNNSSQGLCVIHFFPPVPVSAVQVAGVCYSPGTTCHGPGVLSGRSGSTTAAVTLPTGLYFTHRAMSTFTGGLVN